MKMRKQKTLLSIAVAAGLGVASLPAVAAPTVYGDLAVAYASASAAGGNTSSSSSLNDNVSLLGVKGDAAVLSGTKFFYDFNFILDTVDGGATPSTHYGVIGLEGPYGTVSTGRDNGLFSTMVDGSSYQTNWFYTPGMSSLQVGKAITYVSPTSSGLKGGVQAFDIGNAGSSSTNFTVAGSYAAGGLTIGAGVVKYSDYGDGSTKYSASSDTNQMGSAQNEFSGYLLKSKAGISAGYTTGPFGVVLAYDVRKPSDKYAGAIPNIKTTMLTGSYAVSSKTTLVANYSSTKVSGQKGNVVTLMASYAPASDLFFSVEYQSSNANANAGGLEGASNPSNPGATPPVVATDSSHAIALGATYSF